MAQEGTSPRMQSAPITIAYDNQETRRFWRDSYRWHNQVDSDEEEEYEQNHHSDAEEDQVAHYNGFSGGDVAEVEQAALPVSNSESEEEKQDVVAAVEPVVEQIPEIPEAPQKSSADAAYDIFEQLLAENEAQIRRLIRSMSHYSFFTSNHRSPNDYNTFNTLQFFFQSLSTSPNTFRHPRPQFSPSSMFPVPLLYSDTFGSMIVYPPLPPFHFSFQYPIPPNHLTLPYLLHIQGPHSLSSLCSGHTFFSIIPFNCL